MPEKKIVSETQARLLHLTNVTKDEIAAFHIINIISIQFTDKWEKTYCEKVLGWQYLTLPSFTS